MDKCQAKVWRGWNKSSCSRNATKKKTIQGALISLCSQHMKKIRNKDDISCFEYIRFHWNLKHPLYNPKEKAK